MMHALYVPKSTCWDEVSEIKPVALAIIELHLPEGIKQEGRQAVRQKIPLNSFLKFCSNLLEAFRVVLEAFLGYVYQYCQGTRKKL